MSPPGVDLVIERLVLDGIDIEREGARTLAGLIEDELRAILAAGDVGREGATLLDAKPLALGRPLDLRVLARVLARRIASEAARAGGERV